MDSKEKTGLGMPPVTVPGAARDELRTARVNRWLGGAVVVLVAAVIALGLTLIAQSGDETTPQETAGQAVPMQTAEERIDLLLTTISSGDLDAAAELYAEDAIVVTVIDSEQPTVYEGRDGARTMLGNAGQFGDWTLERASDVIGQGPLAGYVELYHGSGGFEGMAGVTAFLFDEDGKIATQVTLAT